MNCLDLHTVPFESINNMYENIIFYGIEVFLGIWKKKNTKEAPHPELSPSWFVYF